ncbi:AMP-binding protein [Streptomyces sp. NBC_00091]|uniref:AMP-binding protein n=1 Tax=Streptomyces sp. NBC_00091 TaxID=2975648 RepID=UPI00225A7015|nr:AMP-binding protein [Streptomyces sp. NBC_00091]MCX5380684.1 AMP-binding protein [Streptomyces sp. NBC_00091]
MTQGTEPVRFGKGTTDTVLHHFERRARDTPGAPALITGAKTVEYGQLDRRANRLAHRLLASGLPSGGLVAVGTAQQAELAVCLLAVLKAGGVYTVVDVTTPAAGRRQLAAAPPFALLTHTAHQAALDDAGGLRVIRLDEEAAEIAERPGETPPARPAAGAQAALLFTGSAVPRPVPVGHALLLAAYEGWAEVARLTPEDRHLITAGPDVTAFAAGWTRALCSGGALVLPEGAAWTPEGLRRAVRDAEVSVLHTDPAGAGWLLTGDAPPAPAALPGARRAPDAALRSLRLLAVGGDRLYLDEQSALQDRLRPGARVLNVYALTEAAGTGTWFELPQLPRPLDDPERISLLGTPFPGCRVHVLDGEIALTPPGGDPIPTGDFGVLRPDGLLEFVGRVRDRFELAGRRIDPYPLESVIRTHPGVGAALVAGVSVGGGGHRLVAYVSPPPGAPADGLPDPVLLREYLTGRVPAGQVPRAVIRMRALPRTRAGREDRTQLPQPPLLLAPVPTGRGGGKHGGRSAGKATGGSGAVLPLSCALGCGAPAIGLLSRVVTNLIWPGSTDLTGVPNPWALLFWLLYLCECLAFGVGVAFLFGGRGPMLAQGRGRGITTAAHLAIVYLLIAWWPQDNLYRLAAKQDWPRQAALVYAFNVPLMVAAVVVALYATRKPASPFDFDD